MAKRVFWGRLPDGRSADLLVLGSENGAQAAITTYGGTLVSLLVSDSHRPPANVVLGYEHLSDYLANSDYFCGTIGRYANRIAKGTFALNGQVYTLSRNEGTNTLHGGFVGFDKKLWLVRDLISNSEKEAVQLELRSEDGDEGFPGNLIVQMTYTLRYDNQLQIDYEATSDRDTVINFTNHSYFNLGSAHNTVLNHELMINADGFLPINRELIPTGVIAPVEGSPFDFRCSTRIGARIDMEDSQLLYGRGYDHNWVLNRRSDDEMTLAAKVFDPETGRSIRLWTTEPGIQFYSGNILKPAVGRGGIRYGKYSGFCLETQHFPDSPNRPQFPSTVLRKGRRYFSSTLIEVV